MQRVAIAADSRPCKEMRALAKRFGLVLAAGFFERSGTSVFNSCLIAYPNGKYAVQRKHNLTEAELAVELSPGPAEREVIAVNGVRLAVLICSDTGMDGISERMLAQGIDFRLCPSGGGGKLADMLHEADLQTREG